MKTVTVNSKFGRTEAYAEKDGRVRVWCNLAGYYVPATDDWLTEGQRRFVRGRAKEESETVSGPVIPACTSKSGHEWTSPHEVVGGLKENPGVFGHGGGVVIREVCAHCGRQRRTDTWTDGQPKTTVQYL